MTSFSNQVINDQVEKILASGSFINSHKLSQFLRFVVTQVLDGQSDRIKQYTIAVEALGYDSGFDPLTNPSVRVHAGQLRRAIEQYYHTKGIADPIRISIPKGSYVPVFKENHLTVSNEHASVSQPTASKSSGQATPKPSIAVMMFSCLNTQGEYNYLATGLTEEIIIALTLFPEFVVIGPLFRDHLPQSIQDDLDIGEYYGVRFLLDGSLRRQIDNFRLSVRLIDTQNGQQLWGRMIDVNPRGGSLGSSEDIIVGQLVATIADTYGVIPRTLLKEPSENFGEDPDTYQAILRYFHYFRTLTDESYVEAFQSLEKVVEKNPDHAYAVAALSDLVATSYQFGYDDDQLSLARAEDLARKSIALDPNCQTARFAMALVHFLKFESQLYLEEAQKVIELNPNNANCVAAISLFTGMVNHSENAAELMRQSMRLNPHHPGWYHLLDFIMEYRRNDYLQALNWANKFNTPGIFWDPLIRAATFGHLNREDEAKTAVDGLLNQVPDFENRGLKLMARLVYSKENVESLRRGLQKAGLHLN